MPESKVRDKGTGRFLHRKAEALYFLAPRADSIFVNSIVEIMGDEGPRPMRNMRPSQKQRTGADRFKSEHHGVYEARGRQSRDEVGRVHAHNSAYPKMYDELDNRRTTAKPSMRLSRTASQRERYQPLCCRCLRLQDREQQASRRYSRSPYKRLRYNKMKSKVTKPKQRFTRKYPTRSRYSKPKYNLNKGCQYYQVLESKSVSTYDEDYAEDNLPGSSKKQESNDKLVENEAKELKRENSAISLPAAPNSNHSQNPSAPSLSSYNSYLSMDHEPMVDS